VIEPEEVEWHCVASIRNCQILVKKLCQIKRESGALAASFGYSAGVFSKSNIEPALFAKACVASSLMICAACAGPRVADDAVGAPQVFYTVTGEIALSRNEARVAALQYTAAAMRGTDLSLMARASEVTEQTLQPSLATIVAARWISLDPKSLDAHRAAAKAALALDHVGESADQYRIVIDNSPRGADVELTQLESELGAADDVFAARQLADRLAAAFPASPAALRLAGFCALRADDPAAAVRSFNAALAALSAAGERDSGQARRDLEQGLWRARILTGDWQEPLAESQALAESDATPTNQLDYALLLLAAQKNDAAIAELEELAAQSNVQPVALRLLGLIEFQDGKLEAAARDFTALLGTGKFIDDSFYYLGLIAERDGDFAKALRLYAQVQGGDNAVSALLRASNILKAHGAAPAAEQVLAHLLEDQPGRAPEVLAARAKIYSESGDSRQAIEVLGRGVREYPDSVDIRYAIASAYEEEGNIGEALRELKQVLKLRPNDPSALNAYGYTLADHKRHLGEARALIERAYAAAPKNAAILDSLGWVLYRQGHADQALPYLKQAYADDRGGDIAAHYGEALWQIGQRDEAERIWTEASAADSDNRLLNATRQRLHASQ
jgi:tetratricopeptide (TPR) repeat protein